ncbi:hypothetical protein ACFE04_021834 [Oxalis oulophora]
MVNPRRLLQLAKKLQRVASTNRGRITSSDSAVMAGHFVVYTSDKTRFVIPLEYLNKSVFKGILKLSEEEFGLQSNGPITLPCDSSVFEYVILLTRKEVPQELEKALLTSLLTGCTLSSTTRLIDDFYS